MRHEGAHKGRPYVMFIRVGAALVAALPRQKPIARCDIQGTHDGCPYAMSIPVAATLVVALFFFDALPIARSRQRNILFNSAPA
jgi:hypothetical protein